MDYERKVLAGAGLVAAVFVAVLGLAMAALSATVAVGSRLDEAFDRQVLLAQNLRGEKMHQNALVAVYVLDGEPAILDRLHEADAAFDRLAERLQAEPLSPEARTRLASVVAHEAALEEVERSGVALRRGGAPVRTVDAWFRERARDHSRAVSNELSASVRIITERYRAAQAPAQFVSRTVLGVLATACLATLLFGAAMSRLLLRLTRQKRELDAARDRLAERERELSQARKEAVETVAHDLRSPLTAIAIASDLLRDGLDASAPRSAKLVDAVAASADTMTRLIADVLDHAKIEAGAFALDRRPVDLAPVVEGVVGRFELIATQKAVALVRKCPASLPPVEADSGRVEQVLSNLIGNAVKFTPANGLVEVSVRQDGRDLLVAVTDTGPGLEPAQLERVFDRHWQDRRTASQGTGLGLAIAKAVVDAHGGRLEADSRPGRGATFSVRLPLAADLQPAAL